MPIKSQSQKRLITMIRGAFSLEKAGNKKEAKALFDKIFSYNPEFKTKKDLKWALDKDYNSKKAKKKLPEKAEINEDKHMKEIKQLEKIYNESTSKSEDFNKVLLKQAYNEVEFKDGSDWKDYDDDDDEDETDGWNDVYDDYDNSEDILQEVKVKLDIAIKALRDITDIPNSDDRFDFSDIFRVLSELSEIRSDF